MLAIWCWAVEKILSDPRRIVHAPHTTDFKSWSFLKSPDLGKGFERQGIEPTLGSGFQVARIEAMPNNTFNAPRRALDTGAAKPASAFGAAIAAPVATAPAAAHAIDQEAIEAARAAAFEEGLAQGRAEGLQDALREQQAQQAAQTQAQGQQATQILMGIHNAMTAFRQDPNALFEPLKKLALHLAEELVLGELSLSPQAIDRLVQRSVDTLDTSASTPLVIQLNPQDLQVLREHPDTESDRPERWTWEADAHLLPGSVRIKANDTLVSDFIEHRLTSLAQTLLQPATPWAAQSAFNPERFGQRQNTRQVEDVEVRVDTQEHAPSYESDMPDMPLDTATDLTTEPLTDPAPQDIEHA